MKKKYLITRFIIILGTLVLSRINISNNKDLAVYIENELNSSIPASNENLYVNKIDCDNNVNAYWDNDKWGLFISNFSKKTKCNLYFIHDTEKPYWQIEEVERTSVLSTDIFTIKISGNDSLSKVTSSLDTSSLSFYVNDTLQSPIKVELTKSEELNQKITYSLKVHMVGGEGNLKLKINSNTLTDNETNQNDEITLNTGITVNKNPAKIMHFYDSSFTSASYQLNFYKNLLDNYYKNVTHNSNPSLDELALENYDLIFFNNGCWTVPTVANYIFSLGINVFSVGNDSTSALDIISTSITDSKVGNHKKVINNGLTYYLSDLIAGGEDNLNLIKFVDEATVLYKNNTNNIEYDSLGYIKKNDKTWLHSQYISNKYIIPIIQFTLGELKWF